MNVACTACPAKYAVPDERVRGKRARITCKHCGTSIIVDGTHLGPSDGGSVVAARPARQTMLGMGQVGAPATSGPVHSAPVHSAPVHSAPLNSAPSNAPPSGGSAWLVALADGRREPASQARIVDLFAAGTIDASTYIWREGMPEWKTPFTVPDVAAALNARGFKPKPASLFPAAGENDPEEETRIASSPVDDPMIARARAAALAAAARPAPAQRSFSPPPEDDDGITIARSGPPSSPVSLPPLRRASDPPPAAGVPARPGLGTSPPGRLPAPSQTRNAPPSALPPARSPSEPPPAAAGAGGRRPRAYTLPGDLVIPLTGPAAPPPTPLFAPRGQPFANRGSSSSAPPAQSAMVAPRAPSPSSPPPPSPLPPPPSAPPAPVLPAAVLMAPSNALNMPAPARNPYDSVEVPPRSAAPVSVALEYPLGPQRRRRTMATVVSLGLVIVAGVGFAAYWKSKARPPKIAAVAPTVSATVQAAAPSAQPAPEPSAEPEAPTPEPSTQPAKPSARERSAPAAARAAAAKRDDSKPASARKADLLAKLDPGEAASESAASEGESEAPARAEEPPKKADTGPAGTAPFDRESAANALTDAALRAGTCRMLGGPTGSSQATVTFAPSGHVSAASVGGDFAGSVVGACIVKLFRSATVPAFAGDPVTVSKRFNVE